MNFGKKTEPVKTEPVQPVQGPFIPVKVPALFIRSARVEDKDQILRLGNSIEELKWNLTSPFLTEEELEDYLKYHNHSFVATIAGKIVAFVIGEKSGPLDRLGCIVFLAVALEYRKLGIARALLLECEEDLNTKDMYLLSTSESSTRFYEHLGYREGKTVSYMSKERES